jgi:hypothetical protein
MFRQHRLLVGLIAISLILMAFSYPAQIDQQRRGIPWWVWVIIIDCHRSRDRARRPGGGIGQSLGQQVAKEEGTC